MFVGIVVCACSRHALGLKICFFWFFVSRKGCWRTISRKTTAWLFHVGADRCGLTMQVSCLKRKPNKVAGAQGDIPEVVGWYRHILRYTFSDTTNVKYTLSCTRPSKIIANGIGVPHHICLLLCYAATRLALQLRQERSQVACSNKKAQRRLTEPNGTPAMDLGHMNIVWSECICMLGVYLTCGILFWSDVFVCW